MSGPIPDPDWPGAMRLQTAARYVDMSPHEFEREVVAGTMPLPIALVAGDRWLRIRLDKAIEGRG